MKKKLLEKIILIIMIISFSCVWISFIVYVFLPVGWCVNSETINNLYFYKEQAQIINSNTLNKTYSSKESLILEIKNVVNKDFYEENISNLTWNIQNSYSKPKEFYFNPLYIPSEKDIEKLKLHKNKIFKTTVDFELMLNSLDFDKNFINLIKEYKNNISDTKMKFFYLSIISGSIFFSCMLISFIFVPVNNTNKEQQEEIRREEREQPNKIKPTWEYGKFELMEQLEVTKKQIRITFWSSLVAIFIGLTLIFKIILTDNLAENISILGIIGGIISEFIGATLLFMYKSLIQQVNENLKILERLNFVGIGIKILDTIESDNKQEVNNAKMKLAQQIINKIQQNN